MKRKILLITLRVLSYVLVAAISVGLTMAFGHNKLTQLETLIKTFYVDEDQVDYTALEDAAAAAMIDALPDGWSYYISASEYDAYQNNKDNTFVGVGITIQARQEEDGFDIVKVTPDSSAAQAGIQPGDILTEAAGQSLAGMTISEASTLVRGEEGTQVTLGIQRGDQLLKLQLTRQKMQVPVAQGKMLEGNIGYVRIENFNGRCADETIAQIDSLRQQGAVALIFDVRGNPGGYKDEMVQVLDYLLPEGDLFRSVNYSGKEEVDKSDASCVQLPMAVLIDGESYSAAEFFAAALSEYDWAVTVGEPTVGKGHFQVTYQLPDGSAVALSVGKYFTPNGVSLSEAGGLVPDVPSQMDDESAAKLYSGILDPEDDPQLQAAIEALK